MVYVGLLVTKIILPAAILFHYASILVKWRLYGICLFFISFFFFCRAVTLYQKSLVSRLCFEICSTRSVSSGVWFRVYCGMSIPF